MYIYSVHTAISQSVLKESIPPISVPSPYKECTVLDRSNTGIVGSNPTRHVDVCERLSVLCCPV
jgi:hypothetical protein